MYMLPSVFIVHAAEYSDIDFFEFSFGQVWPWAINLQTKVNGLSTWIYGWAVSGKFWVEIFQWLFMASCTIYLGSPLRPINGGNKSS